MPANTGLPEGVNERGNEGSHEAEETVDWQMEAGPRSPGGPEGSPHPQFSSRFCVSGVRASFLDPSHAQLCGVEAGNGETQARVK